MEGILQTFGLDWPKFFSQVIIVLLVYFILSKYAFGPVLAMLEARRKRIADGESNLKTIEAELGKAEEKVQGENLVRKAGLLALRADMDVEAVTSDDFETALKETRPSVTAETEREYERMVSELKQESPTGDRRIGFQLPAATDGV